MPDLIRHPAYNALIPAFAGMTSFEILSCRVNNCPQAGTARYLPLRRRITITHVTWPAIIIEAELSLILFSLFSRFLLLLPSSCFREPKNSLETCLLPERDRPSLPGPSRHQK